MKRVLLILFTSLVSYATGFVIFPKSYWKDYFSMPASGIIADVVINLLFYAAIVELSLFISRRLNKKISWMVSPLKRLFIEALYQVLGVLLIVVCLAIVYFFFADFVNKLSPPVGLREGFYTLILIVFWALMISAFSTGDFMLKNWRTAALQSAELEIKAAQSKQLLSEIELQALKLQLDPHFVFNNLSVLSELILKDQQLGYEYTINFTRVYRYLLVNAKKKLISLREELKFLEAYLFLINSRMGKGCVFRIDIDNSKLEKLVPPVTLQLFIENAIKYNRTEEENPLHVHIYSNGDDELVVSNNLLPLFKKPESTKIGLQNIIDRYALLGDRMPTIEKTEESFTIKVPLLQ